MELLINTFNIVLYQPLFNALVFLYQYLPGHDFGVAVIILTALIRLILYPSMVQSIKSQKILSELQPKMREIQERFKNDKQKQTKEIMALYQKEKINPLGGCLPLLIQLPILFALYRVFWKGLEKSEMGYLYNFIPHPEMINPNFLGVMNLADPNLVLAVLAGIAQFFQTKMLTPRGQSIKSKDTMTDFSNKFQKQMLYFFPVFTIFILWKLPAAIGLYWITTSLFSIIQQYLILRPQKNEIGKS